MVEFGTIGHPEVQVVEARATRIRLSRSLVVSRCRHRLPGTLRAVRQGAETHCAEPRSDARVLETGGPFPERLPVIGLAMHRCCDV